MDVSVALGAIIFDCALFIGGLGAALLLLEEVESIEIGGFIVVFKQSFLDSCSVLTALVGVVPVIALTGKRT